MEETRQDRQRLLARNRKRRQRARQREHKALVGAKTLSFEIYQGTDQALQVLCKASELEPSELITVLVHNLHELVERDPSRFKELVSFKGVHCEHH
ncbi:hypothetical protein SAMN02745127_02091 [Oceanospirillum multiglobuliferum]|uniref:Uncharacterized protein n=1 Tax=Oceanospirillum multiglobuliferum TaxID=64969 RepID=A0A1T4QYM4_9GAMM|nr:hypothetical protein [Oceanospirillum multiglobuliferum]OPX57049.1 hypothetical protein BTE48_01060 [Oceanospirillum multiglobuliferum]SKA08922.1 hypothetical protein SAMN02745127_02091 [Oceanospirillum multiglobuliferum]